MVRAGAVVTERFRGPAAEEERAGVMNVLRPLFGILDGELQMFGSNRVGHAAGFLKILRHDDGAAGGKTLFNDVAAGHRREQFGNRGLDGDGKLGVGRQKHGLGEFIVLGLAEQVHRDPVGIRSAVADHEDFGRTGDHVDADAAEYMALGSRHVGVARTDDLVDAGNRLRAVGKCGDGLSTADGVGSVDATETGRREHQLIFLAARRRHHHFTLADAGDVGRHGVHEHGARVGGLAARHVQTDRIHGGHPLAHAVAEMIGHHERLAEFVFMELADAFGCLGERFALFGGKTVKRRLHVFGRDDELVHRGDRHAVETVGVFEHGFVAADADVLDDGFGTARDFRIDARISGDEFGEFRLELRIGGIELTNRHNAPIRKTDREIGSGKRVVPCGAEARRPAPAAAAGLGHGRFEGSAAA